LILFRWRGLADIEFEWSRGEAEFVKSGLCSKAASSAFHDKKVDDSHLLPFFPLVKRDYLDERILKKEGKLGVAKDWQTKRHLECPGDQMR